MKVAFLMYGQPRNYLSGYNVIKKFLSNQNDANVDFFYHCWTINNDEKYPASPWRNIHQNELYYRENTIEHLKELYNPIAFEYEVQKLNFDVIPELMNTNVYKNTCEPCKLNTINVISQMYSRNKVRNLLDKYTKETNITYDCVILTRFDITMDIHYLPNLKLNNLDLSKIHVSNSLRPRKIFSDNFIISPLSVFLKWFNIYEELLNYIDNTELLETVKSLGEGIAINPEELVFSKYILHYKNVDNIIYLS